MDKNSTTVKDYQMDMADIVCNDMLKNWTRTGRLHAIAYDAIDFHYDGSTYSYYIALREARKALASRVSR
jgi:hypothetical protein